MAYRQWTGPVTQEELVPHAMFAQRCERWCFSVWRTGDVRVACCDVHACRELELPPRAQQQLLWLRADADPTPLSVKPERHLVGHRVVHRDGIPRRHLMLRLPRVGLCARGKRERHKRAQYHHEMSLHAVHTGPHGDACTRRDRDYAAPMARKTSSVRNAVVELSASARVTSVSDGKCSAKYFCMCELSTTVDTNATGNA